MLTEIFWGYIIPTPTPSSSPARYGPGRWGRVNPVGLSNTVLHTRRCTGQN